MRFTRNIQEGDKFEGFIKHIRPDNKIDVAAGKPGYERVEDASEKILRLLSESNGYLPYYDKSSPEEIYDVFGMSKKTFKMVTGSLYKQRKIIFTETGIKLVHKKWPAYPYNCIPALIKNPALTTSGFTRSILLLYSGFLIMPRPAFAETFCTPAFLLLPFL